MSSSDKNDKWEWVVPAEASSAPSYDGSANDLSSTINTGNCLSALRSQAGLSAQDVEDYAGVKKADLLAIEAGLLHMDSQTAESLAMVLGVSVDELHGAGS